MFYSSFIVLYYTVLYSTGRRWYQLGLKQPKRIAEKKKKVKKDSNAATATKAKKLRASNTNSDSGSNGEVGLSCRLSDSTLIGIIIASVDLLFHNY